MMVMKPVTNIKQLRNSRGMTQEQVGILAGMSKSQISRMEKGVLGSPETFDRVLSALGYQAVIQIESIRPADSATRESVLSMLKVYFDNNKEKYGIEAMGLFGSFARNEQKADSDIDILIRLKKPDLFLYAAISQQLEAVFGRKVDLISAKSQLPESFRINIEKDIIYV